MPGQLTALFGKTQEAHLFEDLTRAQQQARTAGWTKPDAHSTVAAIIYRGNILKSWDNVEILVARRVKGSPEVQGYWQNHFGTYVFPTDDTVSDALIRGLKEKLGLSVGYGDLGTVGQIGPALWKSKLSIVPATNGKRLRLEVTDEQAEKLSPFVMTVHCIDATVLKLGKHDDTIEQVQWVNLMDAIYGHGDDVSWIYWQLVYMWIGRRSGALNNTELLHCLRPGVHQIKSYNW